MQQNFISYKHCYLIHIGVAIDSPNATTDTSASNTIFWDTAENDKITIRAIRQMETETSANARTLDTMLFRFRDWFESIWKIGPPGQIPCTHAPLPALYGSELLASDHDLTFHSPSQTIVSDFWLSRIGLWLTFSFSLSLSHSLTLSLAHMPGVLQPVDSPLIVYIVYVSVFALSDPLWGRGGPSTEFNAKTVFGKAKHTRTGTWKFHIRFSVIRWHQILSAVWARHRITAQQMAKARW